MPHFWQNFPSRLPVHFFPMFVSIAGKGVLIFGGGNIALRRIKTLTQFDCRIEIIAPRLHPELEALMEAQNLARPDSIRAALRTFSPDDICAAEAPFFVLAATNDRGVNHHIALECAAHNIPVSVADSKEESTFYFPAIVLNDTIVAGISSGGRCHGAVRAAAQKIRDALALHLLFMIQ